MEQVAEFCTTDMNTTQYAWALLYIAAAYGDQKIGAHSMINLEINGPGQAVWTEIQSLKRIAGMMKDRPTLDYDWSDAPSTLRFSLDEADLLTGMDGIYSFKSIDEDTTEVTYELEVSLSMPIPAMMRQKAEKATIDAALSQLKTHLEG
jgi:hypothetical protein